MNLFRSEEHARNWSGYKPEAEGGLLSLAQILEVFSAPHFRERGNGRYISTMGELRSTFMDKIKEVTNDDPFWRLP